jgi:hypothetical protein
VILLLLALLTTPAPRHEPIWPGFAWAAVPAAVDWHMTSRCISSGACAEASLAGGTRAWTAVTMAGGVAVQTWVDRELRQHGRRGWAWVVRGFGVLWHGWLALHAYRLDNRAP